MNRKQLYILAALVLSAAMLLGACGQAVTETPVEPSAAPTEAPAPTEAAPEPTVAPTEAGPCLTIGALYGGPITDAGYNQAMHEAVMDIKKNIDCVEIIEAENVPDEAGATTTME